MLLRSSLIVVVSRLTLFVSITATICVGALASGVTQNKLAMSNNDFAFVLYRAIGESNEGRNTFLSPVSISIGLGMLYAGAGGKTKSQLASVMRLNDFGPESVNYEFRNLIETFKAPGNNYTLLAANRLFGQKGYTFLDEFIRVTKDYYRAELEELDFGQEPDKSRLHINDWVAKQTADKVKDLLPDGSITDSTALVLVNAIYFKGLWSYPFNARYTMDKTFHLSRNKLTSIEMMSMGVKNLSFYNSTQLSSYVLELPYVGGRASMFVFLPHDVEGLSSVEKGLNGQTLEDVFRNMRIEKVTVSLPKFVLDQGVALKQFLRGIGIVDVFDNNADLSGIDGGHRLVVTEAMHKAYVAVDEEGTEAAGSTGIIVSVKSGRFNTINFVADRPFLFMIVDKTTGSVLFIGRLTQPPQQGDGNIGEFGKTGEQRCCAGSAPLDLRPSVGRWLVAAFTAMFLVEGLRRL